MTDRPLDSCVIERRATSDDSVWCSAILHVLHGPCRTMASPTLTPPATCISDSWPISRHIAQSSFPCVCPGIRYLQGTECPFGLFCPLVPASDRRTICDASPYKDPQIHVTPLLTRATPRFCFLNTTGLIQVYRLLLSKRRHFTVQGAE